MNDANPSSDLKLRAAGSIKWNVIDRVSSQVLYAVTGIILARMLSQEDFGLVGAVLVFHAFASLLVDSGFSYALIQRKSPTRLDYSSVLWSNLAIAVVLYGILFVAAPFIAMCFQADMRLVPLSRVMFLTFILNASAIVQTNRLMKRMNVKPIAVSNCIGLAAGAVIGIWLAIEGYGAWAIVWQSIVLSAVKSAVLWIEGRWMPLWSFSWPALRSFFRVGSGMLATSFLNTLFLNIYSFVIGNRVGLASLGYYTQSDKWSKMGISSLSQVVTSSFLPVLSSVQDDRERFLRVISKMNRMTAYLLFPAMIGLMVIAEPLFHLLFGTKWDPSISLFQLLLLRGIFCVLGGLYNNYILALGRSGTIVWLEVVRDGMAVIALAVTFPYIGIATDADPVYGIRLMLWGQVLASVVAWSVALIVACRVTGASLYGFISGCVPYLMQSLVIGALMWLIGDHMTLPVISVALQIAFGLGLYILVNHLLRSRIQADVIGYLRGRL